MGNETNEAGLLLARANTLLTVTGLGGVLRRLSCSGRAHFRTLATGGRGRSFTACLAASLVIVFVLGGSNTLAQNFYVTQPGDNLFRIALRYQTTVEALAAANGIRPPYTIHTGTRILLAEPSPSAQMIYIVQPGDNLFRIALRYQTTADALAAANGIPPPYTIRTGIRILLAAPSPSAQMIYVVQPGDNLYSIARRKGITAEVLAAANRIQSPYIIHVGNRLTVPAPWCPPDEELTPALPVEVDIGDRNLCNSEWADCGDGSTYESQCRWKVGWCVANLNLDAEECANRFCANYEEPEPTRERARVPKPNPPPASCAFVQRYDGDGNKIPLDAVDTLCLKNCRLGVPPFDECKLRGYS